MIDISRDKVPTLGTLEAMIERLARWKYQPRGAVHGAHLRVRRPRGSVARCRPVHGRRPRPPRPACAGPSASTSCPTRTPSATSIAGFATSATDQLAIAPDGFEWIFGIRRSPTTIDPAKPGILRARVRPARSAHVRARQAQIHIGLDEPWELSPERQLNGPHGWNVLPPQKLCRGRKLLVWGDVPAGRPELVTRLAELSDVELDDLRMGIRGQSSVRRPALGAREGRHRTWVCPGTSSWMSVTGRAVDMLENIRSAAKAGEEHDRPGFLVTDWGDFGHHQYLPVSEPGLAAAAGFSWCASAHGDLELEDLAMLLDAHAFDDPAGRLGEALVALGSVHHLVTPQPPNMSPLVGHLLFPQWPVGRGPTKGLTTSELDSVEDALESARRMLASSRPGRVDGELVIDELGVAASWLELACDDARERLAGDGSLSSVPQSARHVLAARCDRLTDEHRRLWLERNRSGGLDESTAWLDHLKACYVSGQADRAWFGPFG